MVLGSVKRHFLLRACGSHEHFPAFQAVPALPSGSTGLGVGGAEGLYH